MRTKRRRGLQECKRKKCCFEGYQDLQEEEEGELYKVDWETKRALSQPFSVRLWEKKKQKKHTRIESRSCALWRIFILFLQNLSGWVARFCLPVELKNGIPG